MPFTDVIEEARAKGQDVTLALTGVADPFVLQIQVSAVAGLVFSSPIWLYQLWRFVTPGLHRNERRWALGFVAIATPLFAAGITLAYNVLPWAWKSCLVSRLRMLKILCQWINTCLFF